jgi:hypothetical protein
VRDDPGGAVLELHVQPGAARTGFAGLHGGALKFRVAAPPAEGAANEALREHLAQRFAIARGRVTLLAGHSSRHKRIQLAGIAAAQVRALLRLDPEA